jgi:hypothetical protein
MDPQLNTINLNPIGTETSDPQMYRLVQPHAIRLRDLHMHKKDLELLDVWLGELLHRFPQGAQSNPTARDEAFWTASVVTFFRCFTPSARGQLNEQRVFANEPDGAIEAFKRLHDFRNKTIVHDENFFNQGFIGVPVANPEGPVARVGPVQILQMKAVTFDFEEISNLLNLSKAAIRWIDAESSQLHALLGETIKKMSRAEIIEHGPVVWTSPSFETVGVKRSRQ